MASKAILMDQLSVLALLAGEKGQTRRVPVCRWVCDQCRDNLIDDDDATLKDIKRQLLTDAQYTAWEEWYDRYVKNEHVNPE